MTIIKSYLPIIDYQVIWIHENTNICHNRNYPLLGIIYCLTAQKDKIKSC